MTHSEDGYQFSPPAMSYSLIAFEHMQGRPLESSLEDAVYDPPECDDPAAAKELQEHIALSLEKLYPSLRRFTLVSDADSNLPQVRLATPDIRGGVQIHIDDTHASVQIPFWNNEEAARIALLHGWEFLKVIAKETNWLCVFDEQGERTIDMLNDFDMVLDSFVVSGSSIKDEIAALNPQGKPWWKFW